MSSQLIAALNAGAAKRAAPVGPEFLPDGYAHYETIERWSLGRGHHKVILGAVLTGYVRIADTGDEAGDFEPAWSVPAAPAKYVWRMCEHNESPRLFGADSKAAQRPEIKNLFIRTHAGAYPA